MPSANVHFRNLTAAHVDDDHGGCGQHSGPLRQGSPHVYVQNRPLVREKDLPSCAGRPDHEPAPHCHVGEGGGSAITTMKPGGAAKRGGVQSAPRKKCTAAGHTAAGRTARDPLHSLSPLRSLVPPANPRPSGSAIHRFPPPYPLPAQAAPHHLSAHHVPVPLPPQPSTPYLIFTPHDTAEGLKTGVQRTFDFFRGMHDQANDMVNPVKIYQAAHDFGQHEANIYIPDPDGHVEDGDAYARKMGHEILDGLNPLNKKSAYETGKTVTNIGAAVVPGVEELNALRGLKVAAEAADGSVVAARAAAERAAGTPGEAAAEDALRGAKARQAAAHEAYQAKLPGAGARKIAAKARAAAQKAKERRTAGQRDPSDAYAPHTDASRAKAQRDREAMQERWRSQGRPTGQGHPVLARASEAPKGNSTAAIGMPNKTSTMQMARRSESNNLAKSLDLSERIKANRNLKTRPDVKPAHSTQVPYGGDNLSQKAIEYRKSWVHSKTGKKGYWNQGNIAVYEYRDGEKLRTYAVKSIPRKAGEVGLHSEPAGLLDLDKMGIKLDQITQVYTEREPCMSAGNYCGTLLGSELPDIPVPHSFEYGVDPSSQAAGNAALEEALKDVKRTSK